MNRCTFTFCLTFCICPALSQTLTCTFQFTASGTLGTQSLSNTSITITTVGQTSSRQQIVAAIGPSPGYFIGNTSALISVSGMGTFQFTVPTSTYVTYNGSSTFFIFDAGTGTQRDLAEAIVSGSVPWNMLSSLASFSANGQILQWATGTAITTTDGPLVLNNQNTPVIFQATLSGTAVPPPPTQTRYGVLSHIAAGGGWTTNMTLVNTSASSISLTVSFHGDDGSALSLPLTTTNQGVTANLTSSSVTATINPDATLLISTGQLDSTVVGWADVTSTSPIGGNAIFRQTPASGPPSEGTVALQVAFPTAFSLPYDNAMGYVTGVALANLATTSADILVTVWDLNGNQLGAQVIALPGNGHTSFALPSSVGVTTGIGGIVEFQSSAADGIAGLGFRFSPFGTFTSVPTIY